MVESLAAKDHLMLSQLSKPDKFDGRFKVEETDHLVSKLEESQNFREEEDADIKKDAYDLKKNHSSTSEQ